jgi:MFS family permease
MSILIGPLRQRTFALLWGATLLSNLGFWVQDITLSWLVAGLTSSPALVALVPAAAMIPTFIFSLPAGAFGDAVNQRGFLIVSQGLFVFLLAGFAVVVALDRVSVPVIVAFAFIHGTLAAITSPTRQAILPAVVDEKNVRGAVLLSAIGFNGSRAIGPMLGGLVLAYFGSVTAIIAYAATCLAVGLALYRWDYRPGPPKPLHLFALSAEGIRYVWRQAAMRRALGLTSLYFLAVSPLWAFAPLIAKGFAEGNSRIFGLFMMALGLGAVIGGFNRWLTAHASFPIVLASGSAISAVALAIIGLSQSLVLTLVGFFIAGLGWIGVSAGINSYVLVEAKPEFRSRAISIVLIVFSGGLGLGSLLWGQIGQRVTLPPTFIAATVALLIVAGAALFLARASARTSA